MLAVTEVTTTDSLDCQIDYYRQRQLFPLIAELIAATTAIELAYERQGQAVMALVAGWQAIEGVA